MDESFDIFAAVLKALNSDIQPVPLSDPDILIELRVVPMGLLPCFRFIIQEAVSLVFDGRTMWSHDGQRVARQTAFQ